MFGLMIKIIMNFEGEKKFHWTFKWGKIINQVTFTHHGDGEENNYHWKMRDKYMSLIFIMW